MNQLELKQVGRTDVSVSKVGLGTAPIGNFYKEVPEAQAIETIQRCMEAGITLFDTSPVYGGGLAEIRLGAALAGVERDQYVISTKVGDFPASEGWGWEREFDFSRDGVFRSVEDSLKRLRIDWIDILLIHDPDRYHQQALEEAYPAIAELKEQGLVKAIGVGMNWVEPLVAFANEADFDCFMMAGQYSLLNQDGLSLMDLCAEREIGILSAGVYNSGILATGPVPGAKYFYHDASPEILERTRKIEAICNHYDTPLKVAALRFPLEHPATSSVVLGTSSPSRIDGYISALQWPIPPELWADLKKAGLLTENAPISGAGAAL